VGQLHTIANNQPAMLASGGYRRWQPGV